jgi:hypothetical protein
MDKERERTILNYVFGRQKLVAVNPSEKPDFECVVSNEFSFGVEVTEFFRSESLARLARIPGYAGELLANQSYRHKDDKIKIPVEDITYIVKEFNARIPMKAIFIEEGYTHQSVMQGITEVIRSKSEKSEKYRITPVDLVIHDADYCCQFANIVDVLNPIFAAGTFDEIRKSRFREIYLVTREKGVITCLPLRAIVFASEVVTFGKLFDEFYKNRMTGLTMGDFVMPLAAYLVSMFPNLEYDLDSDGRVRFIFGSVAGSFVEGRKLTIQDISLENGPRYSLIDEIEAELDQGLRENLAQHKSGIYWVPLKFAASLDSEHTTESNAS